jgi:hypothetical protein
VIPTTSSTFAPTTTVSPAVVARPTFTG